MPNNFFRSRSSSITATVQKKLKNLRFFSHLPPSNIYLGVFNACRRGGCMMHIAKRERRFCNGCLHCNWNLRNKKYYLTKAISYLFLNFVSPPQKQYRLINYSFFFSNFQTRPLFTSLQGSPHLTRFPLNPKKRGIGIIFEYPLTGGGGREAGGKLEIIIISGKFMRWRRRPRYAQFSPNLISKKKIIR